MAHARRALSKGLVVLGVLLLGVAFSTTAQATTISVELPDLTGPLPHEGRVQVLPGARGPGQIQSPEPDFLPISLPGRSATFDMERAFASISDVSLHLVGHTECLEGSCATPPHIAGTILGTAPPPGTGAFLGTGLLIGPLSGEFELDLNLPAVQGLEDGAGLVSIVLGAPIGTRQPYPTEPVLVITSARLTMIGDALRDGSLPPQTVPEPSVLALAGTALGALEVRWRAGRRAKAS